MSENIHLDNLQKQAEKAKVTEMPAHKLMNKNPITIFDGTKIYHAAKTLISNKISGAPVIDNNKRLIGVVTEYDLLMQTATEDVSKPFKYNKAIDYVKEDTTLNDIIIMFYKKKRRWVPVVDKHMRVTGIVTRVDILSELIND